MPQVALQACRELFAYASENWERFWFTPRAPRGVARLRIVVGAGALWLWLAFTPGLTLWFGPQGLLPPAATQRVLAEGGDFWGARLTYLQWATTDAALWGMHIASLAPLLALLLGWQTRITAWLAWIVVLAYVQAGALVNTQFEPALLLMLLFVCVGPSGAAPSFDNFMRRGSAPPQDQRRTWRAAVSLRLAQVHLAAWSLAIGLEMLAGDAWPTGEGVWGLAGQVHSPPWDYYWLRELGPAAVYVTNLVSHLLVLYFLAFPILVWNSRLRPLMLCASATAWLVIAAATGEIAYAALMAAGNVAFCDGESARGALGPPLHSAE